VQDEKRQYATKNRTYCFVGLSFEFQGCLRRRNPTPLPAMSPTGLVVPQQASNIAFIALPITDATQLGDRGWSLLTDSRLASKPDVVHAYSRTLNAVQSMETKMQLRDPGESLSLA
jgi:hypothetical protein